MPLGPTPAFVPSVISKHQRAAVRAFEIGASLDALVTDGHTSFKYMQIFNMVF